jgi:CDGSH-type Zn-finger protein
MDAITITVKPQGPLVVAGPATIVDPTGAEWSLPPDKVVALCRCGQSLRKPFCDASHNASGWSHPEGVDPATAPPAVERRG